MEYHVPQFIEVEDKVVGPLTLKQFIYLGGTVGLCVVCFVYLPILFAILLSIPIIALGAMLSFYKVNGKPFVEVLEAGFSYYTGAKLFLWKHQERSEKKQQEEAAVAQAAQQAAEAKPGEPRLTRGKLSELAWSLDVKKDRDTEELES